LISGYIVYGTIKKIVGIRLTQEQEFMGADLAIHKIGTSPEEDMGH
jgi:Amt family ammonium transporter